MQVGELIDETAKRPGSWHALKPGARMDLDDGNTTTKCLCPCDHRRSAPIGLMTLSDELLLCPKCVKGEHVALAPPIDWVDYWRNPTTDFCSACGEELVAMVVNVPQGERLRLCGTCWARSKWSEEGNEQPILMQEMLRHSGREKSRPPKLHERIHPMMPVHCACGCGHTDSWQLCSMILYRRLLICRDCSDDGHILARAIYCSR